MVIFMAHFKDMMKSLGKTLSLDNNTNSSDQEVPKRPSDFDLRIPGQTFLWQSDDRPTHCDKVSTLDVCLCGCTTVYADL